MRPGAYVPIAGRLLGVNPIDSLPNYTTTITLRSPASFHRQILQRSTPVRQLPILAMAATLPPVVALGVENTETPKLDSDSPSEIEREEMEVNLQIEGSEKRGLKRRASSSWGEGSGDSPSRKRLKDENVGQKGSTDSRTSGPTDAIDQRALIDDLAQELECGCCAALVYSPVTIIPCQHSFCGRWDHLFIPGSGPC